MEILYCNGKFKRIGSLNADDNLGDIAGICHLTVEELSGILVEVINSDLERFERSNSTNSIREVYRRALR